MPIARSCVAGCDVLFHTAAYFREYYQPGDHWKTLEAINVAGTMQLLAAAEQHGVSKVIYTSSNGVTGAPVAGQPGDETTPPDAISMDNLYFRSKVLAERKIDEFLQKSALPVVLILPAWMFGPGDAAPTTCGQIVLDFLNRRLPGIIDGGGAPVDVRDVAQAMINAVPRPTRRIPYGVSLVYAWFAETFSRLTGKPTLVTINGVKTVRYRRLTNSAKARRELDATFRPLSETLRDEVAWFRQHRPELLQGIREDV